MMFKYMSIPVENYKQFKEKLDIALSSAADNMVRVGYLLMKARDTEILQESGYSGMGEFAQKEYGLTPDQTSRFIGIAERYGDGEGRLQTQWQQYGYTKLSEMLTLPEEVAQAIPPEITREEIRELKAEVKAEEEISPIEVAIEQAEERANDPNTKDAPMIQRFFKAYFEEYPEDFLQAISTDWSYVFGPEGTDRKVVLDALAPSGIRILMARIPGCGKYMLSFKGESALPSFVNVRESTTEELPWREVRDGFSDLVNGLEDDGTTEKMEKIREMWSQLYGKPFPEIEKEPEAKPEKKPEKKAEKKVKIAPAQPKKKASVQKPAKNGGKTEKADEKAGKTSEEPEIISDQPITVTGSKAAGEAPTSGTVKISYDVSNFMNPPKKGFTQEDIDAMEKRINGQENEVPLPPAAREWKIEDSVKVVNRLALDLKDYAESMEKLEKNHNYMYVSDLLFNMAELWTNKIMPEMEELTRLLKQRWDAEDEFKEDEDVQEEE